ncbi:MAG TPA: single-stranded DNA-binding protein [Candidatus Gastranaerophilaceae bacterium]|nr:single-stranded DNA-binding protein [Candidatus Gastranaerophilaceae bacterium]HPT41077.1 single-stranded DNA-binding protein [Candidatus Gastranaerophilaceae bacterium]
MTIAKAVVTGTVYRTPEKRFTTNNVAIWAFVLDIGEKEETLIRVMCKRMSLDEVASSINKGDRILVEGRLEVATAKMDDGSERKIYEIDANTVEKMGATAPVKNSNNEEIVKFAQEEFSDELIGEDEIPF